MTYDEIPPVWREFLGSFEGLRKLGFESSRIFCNVAMDAVTRKLCVFCQLDAQGKTFSINCGLASGNAVSEYARFTTAVSEGQVPQDVLDRVWQESLVYRNKVSFVVALTAKGFAFPKGMS
jgi:hypothetical protein